MSHCFCLGAKETCKVEKVSFPIFILASYFEPVAAGWIKPEHATREAKPQGRRQSHRQWQKWNPEIHWSNAAQGRKLGRCGLDDPLGDNDGSVAEVTMLAY